MADLEHVNPHGGDSAILSPDGLYRYELRRDIGTPFGREIGVMSGLFVVIGLNPSTADATHDDPTIRRCVGFAKRENAAQLVMLNLFAWRSRDPKALRRVTDAVGPETDAVIERVVAEVRDAGGVIVAAWGATDAHRHKRRIEQVARLVPDPRCFGTTSSGHPLHPLYLRADSALVPWSPR